MKEFNPLILFLQEHWLSYHETHILCHEFRGYNFLTTASDMFVDPENLIINPEYTWHGTALGWSFEVDKFVTKLPIISDRFCGILVEKGHSKALFYSLYLPTSGKDEEFLEILSLLSADISLHRTVNHSIIIGADTNQSSKSTRRRTDAMTDFMRNFKLKSILKSNEATFHHNNQTSTSQIDHILYDIADQCSINIDFLGHICKLDNSENLSSHDVILAELKLEASTSRSSCIDYSDTYEDFSVKKPKWDLSNLEYYQIQTNIVLNEIFETYDDPEFIPALCEIVSKAFVLSGEINFDTINHNSDKKKAEFPRFTSEQVQAYEDHKRACKSWREAGRPKDNTDPAKALKLTTQKNLQRINRLYSSEKAHKLHEELMTVHSNDISKVSKKLKSIRGETNRGNAIPFVETLCGTFEDINVLEGFRANTEKLCNRNNEVVIENDFYEMCVKDNEIIFNLTATDEVSIPRITLENLKDIIFKKLKLNKACDVYKLTVEHLRYAGDENLELLLILLNRIIDNLNTLSSPQLNTSVATIVHKGKGKSVYHHKSYRQVRVSPLIGRLLDEFMRPTKVEMTRWQQNVNQYGFTEKVSYLMGALQRHETEKYCIDNKLTFFGCSLDGESAFEVVDRNIQLRELYCAGQNGSFWNSSKFSYENSFTRIKMQGKLSQSFEETLGVKQGQINSSDDYKVYVNSALNTIDESGLGVVIGTKPNQVIVAITGVADDLYLMSDEQNKMQTLIKLAENYGERYMIKYGAHKTNITVIGSQIDMQYYSDVKPWKMDNKAVNVVEDNEHLGQIVSGVRQEGKNIDQCLKKARGSLFSLLGPAFAYKCTLGPLVQMHLFRTYTCPILRSGLSSFALRTSQINPLSLFHRKCMKGFLHLSKSAPTPAIHFLLGELPMEAKIHRDMFALFYSVWQNPNTKIYQILKIILSEAKENSSTWAMNLQHICKMYNFESPLSCLMRDPPSKSFFKELIITKISAFHEKELKSQANSNSKMSYLNVSLFGLRGRHHPCLSNIVRVEDVRKLRPHLKFLTGDYFTYETQYKQSGKGSPSCKLCNTEPESTCHIIAICKEYSNVRSRISTELEYIVNKMNLRETQQIFENPSIFTQFVFDP